MDQALPYERFNRQMLLREMGRQKQELLWNARVLVVGAGGLGCPVLLYLAAAGVGHLGIVDDDVVSMDNLHRQILYRNADIGKLKVEAAVENIRDIHPGTNVHGYPKKLDAALAAELFPQYDLVIDGTDRFASRYLINDGCILFGKPCVYGAISQWEGQVAVFNDREMGTQPSANYRDLFPVPPREHEVLNCAEAGVIGVLPGIIGTVMANEAIKLITGIGNLLKNKLWIYNSLNHQTYIWSITPSIRQDYTGPSNVDEYLKLDYEETCGLPPDLLVVEPEQARQWVQDPEFAWIDVRELHETPASPMKSLQIPLSTIQQVDIQIQQTAVVVFCQSGVRSLQAIPRLREKLGSHIKFYSLQGGLRAWMEQAPE